MRVAKPEKTPLENYCSVEFAVCIDQTKITFKLYCTKIPFSHFNVSLAQFFFVFQHLANLAPPLFLDGHDRREISREKPLAAGEQGGDDILLLFPETELLFRETPEENKKMASCLSKRFLLSSRQRSQG